MRTTLTYRRDMLLREVSLAFFPAVSTPMVIGDLHLHPLLMGEVVNRRPLLKCASFSLCRTCYLWVIFSVFDYLLCYSFLVVSVILRMILLVCLLESFWMAHSISFGFLCVSSLIVFVPFCCYCSNVLSVLISPCLYSLVLFRSIGLMVIRNSLVLALAARACSSITASTVFWKVIQRLNFPAFSATLRWYVHSIYFITEGVK